MRSGRHFLEIDTLGDGPYRKRKTWRLPIGGEYLNNIYPKSFGDLGDLLCTEWAHGPVIELVVYKLSKDGTIGEVFRETARFGFDVLYLDNTSIPSICAGDGDLYGPKEMRVFNWRRDKFELDRRVDVHAVRKYQIDAESE
jgi:hypothetical protein